MLCSLGSRQALWGTMGQSQNRFPGLRYFRRTTWVTASTTALLVTGYISHFHACEQGRISQSVSSSGLVASQSLRSFMVCNEGLTLAVVIQHKIGKCYKCPFAIWPWISWKQKPCLIWQVCLLYELRLGTWWALSQPLSINRRKYMGEIKLLTCFLQLFSIGSLNSAHYLPCSTL